MKTFSFKKPQPLSLRLWHWLNALLILGLLSTVLLRKTLLSWRTNSVLITDKLNAAGTSISPDLAKDIAVSIRNPLWNWHIYLGYGLSFLLIARILVAVFIEKEIPGINAFKLLKETFSKPLPNQKGPEALHFIFVKLGYATFYLATAFMVISGLIMVFQIELGIAKSLIGVVKEIHEVMMWFFVVFSAGHVIGVIIAENGKDSGIVSDMINGGK